MDAKEDIKRRLSVEDVVSGYVELKRAGRNFKALSPFTNEKTPSFMVSPDKQIWHDFSANRGGDIFTFVMEMEGVDFLGAMEILARKAGIELSNYQRGDGKTAELKKRLHKALELASRFYHISLSKNQPPLSYLKEKRGYAPDTIRRFQLGYAPPDGNALSSYLSKHKFTSAEMKQAGLVTQRSGGTGDMFRGRIMIPLQDGTGRVIGFTARLIKDEPNSPKYINTPQSLVYDKSRHVFGLHLAKDQIRKDDFSVLVEGNLDVIASHQAGVANTVATAGTAITRDHLIQLSRLSRNVKLAFDQDRAGLDATLRAIPIASGLDINLSIVDMGEAKDPDELIKRDSSAWVKTIDKSTYVMDWLVEYMTKRHDINTAPGKRAYADALVEVIKGLNDPVEAEHYIRAVAKKLGIGAATIARKVAEAKTKTQSLKPRKSVTTESEPTAALTYIDTFLGLLLVYPDTRDALNKLALVEFERSEQNLVIKTLLGNRKATAADLPDIENYVKIISFRAEEFYGDSSSSARLADAMETARRIAHETKKKQTAQLAERIRAAADVADDDQHEELLKQVHQRLKEE